MKLFYKTFIAFSLFVSFIGSNVQQGFCELPELKTATFSDSLIADNYSNNQTNSQKVYQTKAHGDYGAFAAFGELGYKNFRGSGTYGVYFTPHQRFKVSGEWLTQELKYHFSSGKQEKWVSQYAIGAEYQYLFCNRVFQSVELGSAYVHAFDYKLNSKILDSTTLLLRRIAGSDGALSFVGTTLKLWKCATLGAALDYDWVKFHRTYQSDRLANGFGGSLNFVQQFAKDFALTLGAEFRQPYYSYRGLLNWNRLFSRWGINVGIFGNITESRKGVPHIKTIGAQLGFSFGGKGNKCLPCSEKQNNSSCHSRTYCDVSAWVATPAVYVPVVLSIADPKTIITATSCAPTSSPIPDLILPSESTILYDISPYFSSTLPLTYTATNLPDSTTIDPVTGIISGTPDFDGTHLVTVTATSSCGSTSQSFIIMIGM